MDYYRILHNENYISVNGRYSIIDSNEEFNMYLLEDENSFPYDLFDNIKLHFKTVDNIEYPDYQMIAFPWRVVSIKMHSILSNFANNELVYFHPINVYTKGANFIQYFVVHFKKKLDVLHKEKTVFAGRVPSKPIVIKDKLKGIDLFNYKEPNTSFCISQQVKEELEKNNITGCSYQKISE